MFIAEVPPREPSSVRSGMSDRGPDEWFHAAPDGAWRRPLLVPVPINMPLLRSLADRASRVAINMPLLRSLADRAARVAIN